MTGAVGWLAAQIVVATNVAETSITIDDVTCVIDAGRVKELGYDAERGIARLQVKPCPCTLLWRQGILTCPGQGALPGAWSCNAHRDAC